MCPITVGRNTFEDSGITFHAHTATNTESRGVKEPKSIVTKNASFSGRVQLAYAARSIKSVFLVTYSNVRERAFRISVIWSSSALFREALL